MFKEYGIVVAGLLLILTAPLHAELRPEASAAFDHYAAQVERRLTAQHGRADSFLYFRQDAANSVARLRAGELLIEEEPAAFGIQGYLLHHWRGSLYVPGGRAADFRSVMQDYDHMTRYYSPQLLSSRLLERQGNDFLVTMRVRQQHILTVILDTAYAVHFGELDLAHGYSISRGTKISEIASAGTRHEHALDTHSEHGYLLRSNTYWSYAELPGGLLIQCESITLTRDVPRGLGWAITPFIQSIPRESLEFTLNSTRKALTERRSHGN